MRVKRKSAVYVAVFMAAVLVLWTVWSVTGGRTKVAFLNYQLTQTGLISQANDNPRIRLYILSPEDLKDAGRYDILFINGMGLRITEEERARILKAAERGLPVLSVMATNPDNNINNLDKADRDALVAYLDNGGITNYRNMLNYVRRYIDRKCISAPRPGRAEKYAAANIYHPSLSGDVEEEGFTSVAAYRIFLEKNGLWQENAPRIIVTGQMGEPRDLIASLERTGNVVYPVRNIRPLVAGGQLDSVSPSAIINMAHGRLGDEIVQFLENKNIPLFSPLNVNTEVEKWESDRKGMTGGFLSQSVVTPEIDGAVLPFALFGHYSGEDGIMTLEAIPDRLEDFTETVNRYMSLRNKPDSMKKIAVVYYKGPGQNALTAAGMEVVPSLYNFLLYLRNAGYNVSGLPSSPEALEKLIQARGPVFGSYAEGAASRFMRDGNPAWVDTDTYLGWIDRSLPEKLYRDVVDMYGEYPGEYMSSGDSMAIARIELGNIVLIPQPAAGTGQNDFSMVHGTHAAPPHNYIAAYLYARYGFGADAIIHFGTHGSLEFTPEKQVALSRYDWPDRLVGTVPHFYVYSIANVGEGVIAKRRTYAGLVSCLTAPFTESNVRGLYRNLSDSLAVYESVSGGEKSDTVRISGIASDIKKMAIDMGIASELGLDTSLDRPYNAEEILKIGNFAEELVSEKVTGRLYVMGEQYLPEQVESTVYAMSTDPVAYGLMELDRCRGRNVEDAEKRQSVFRTLYLDPARKIIGRLLLEDSHADDMQLCAIAGITPEELARARAISETLERPDDLMGIMMSMSEKMKDTVSGDIGEMMAGLGRLMKRDDAYTQQEKDFAYAVAGIEQAVLNVYNYRRMLEESPEKELESIVNALDGGFLMPSPGGDPVANPNTLPTGRNLYAVNAEAAPGRKAWEQGARLAENTLELYRKRHGDSLPHKVSYTLWSSEFIETEGATVAQVLYMLGVEPVYDSFGRVADIRLIPSDRLGRPRIDVVVQTSGQLRDIAASRLFLIDRAVRMAAEAGDGGFPNYVAEGVRRAEKILTEKGVPPEDARRMSFYRVFGGLNGSYGTGIQSMVTASDRWNSRSEIARTYMNNMGAYYGSEDEWEKFSEHAFEAALSGTDAVVQPRQSNTWGALSLDHVYEFMGGLNIAVKEVTGKEPDAYLSDYRNRSRVRMQELKEAVGIESRTTVFNPSYIAEKMRGGPGDADAIAETVTNIFGWNVMKPEAIDGRMWNELYDIYVKDEYGLGLHDYFRNVNPAALEEITAVMLESARKGMWKASDGQITDVAGLHVKLVEEFAPSCSGFVCDNSALQDFIASAVDERQAAGYRNSVREIREANAEKQEGTVLKKDRMHDGAEKHTALVNNVLVSVTVLVMLVAGGLIVHRRRKKREIS